MKIFFLVNKLNNGGAERVVSVLANTLYKNGYSVSIAVFSSNDNDYPIENEISKTIIKNNGNTLDIVIRSLRYFLKQKFDIIIGFDILPNIICSILKLLKPCHVIISERNAPGQVKINLILKVARRLLYLLPDTIVFQTNEAMRYYSKRIIKKGKVIMNPVTEGIPQRNCKCEKSIVAMGRLTKQKNYPVLIKAAAIVHEKHPDCRFEIYGQGELENELKELSYDLGQSEYVFFKGYSQNVLEKIVNADIYVLTSDYEGLPNSLIETMCMGFPVISSDCPTGGPRELIVDGENGLLFRTGDPVDLASKIEVLLNDDIYKEKLGKEAEKLIEKVNSERIVREWERCWSGDGNIIKNKKSLYCIIL